MGILEERKAFEEGFERLQRIYKEWQRNPSALVRDSLKKYLIDCYDHLLKLDRIDMDAGMFEESIIAGTNNTMTDPQIQQVDTAHNSTVVEETESINIVLNKEEEIVEELPEIEAIEAEIAAEEVEEEVIEEEVVAKESEEEIIEESVAEIESEATEGDLDPSEVYLSGSEEREIEEYFKSNFPQSEIDEVEVRKSEDEAKDETIIAEEEIEAEELEEENVVSEVTEEETIVEEVINEVVAEETEVEIEEETEVESKSRWSSFFSKDEPKPYEEPASHGEQTQLTLADKLAVTKEEVGVHYELKEQAITDLNGAIPIAKKFEFIRELFADDSTNYKTAVASINEAGEIQKALDISENLAETYNWSTKEKLAEEFNTFVKRRFTA
jgi:hypothetical protein